MFLVNSMKESGLLEGMFCSVPLQGESLVQIPGSHGLKGIFMKMMCFFVFTKGGICKVAGG